MTCCNLLGKCQLIQPKLEAPWHPSEPSCRAASLRLHPKSAEPLRNCPQSKYGTPTNHQLEHYSSWIAQTSQVSHIRLYKFMSCESAPPQAFLSFSHCAVALHICCGNRPNFPGPHGQILCDTGSHSGGSNKQSQTHMPIELNWLRHTFFSFILLKHEQTKITNTTFHPLSCKGLFPKPPGNIPLAKHQDLHLLIFQWSWVLRGDSGDIGILSAKELCKLDLTIGSTHQAKTSMFNLDWNDTPRLMDLNKICFFCGMLLQHTAHLLCQLVKNCETLLQR